MSTVSGHVDRFEGVFVTGWAIAQPDSAPCEIELLDSDGCLLGHGRATEPRSDLATLGHHRTDFSFRVPILDFNGTAAVHVRANGVELVGSPLRCGPGQFDGFVKAERGAIEGWVIERRPGAVAPAVTLARPDGRVLATVQATPDPRGEQIFVTSRFEVPLPVECFGGQEIEIEARVGEAVFARTKAAARLEGFLDFLTRDGASGWLFSPDAPRRHLEIVAFCGGAEIGRGLCRNNRSDLGTISPHMPNIGFDIAFTRPLPSGIAMSAFSLRLAGTGTELFGGPFLAGPRAAFIQAARDGASLAFAAAGGAPGVQAVLRAALGDYVGRIRKGANFVWLPARDAAAPAPAPAAQAPSRPRALSIIIPVYRGTEITRACIESVLAVRRADTDAVILVNDASPDAAMAPLLEGFAREPNVRLLSNTENQGFVRAANQGLAHAQAGDVLLLNADTRLFPGALDELHRVLQGAAEIGTVTALSNNATIFSYPHPTLAAGALDDASWEDLAAAALEANAGQSTEVPTAHGFCMMIKRALLDRLPRFNEVFGRGYGEENEFCLRAADLGFRHVAALGVLVEHRESVSFGDAERERQLRENMPRLEAMFPEYIPTVMDFEAKEGLRRGRWALDGFRLARARAAGARFALVVENWLGGGTNKAIEDIDDAVGYNGARKLRLRSLESGLVELSCAAPVIRATFQADEEAALFALLERAGVELVAIHQLLGFTAGFVERLTGFVRARHGVAFLHDFYTLCPRVTLIDAVGRYCGVADTATCARCVSLGGAHEAARIEGLEPAAHRALFARFLGACRHVVLPSDDAARHARLAFPDLPLRVLAHLHTGARASVSRAGGSFDDIALIGAIGPHKGSGLLAEIARLARLTHPRLRFHVVGLTDIDPELEKIGNIFITGRYKPAELPGLLAATGARLALFLHKWPETFSYTLTEAVMGGLIPVAPDIGAPAARIRAAGHGVIFPFPIVPEQVLAAIETARATAGAGDPGAFILSYAGTTTPLDVASLWNAPKEEALNEDAPREDAPRKLAFGEDADRPARKSRPRMKA